MSKITIPLMLVAVLALCACGVKRNLKLPPEENTAAQQVEKKE